MTYLLPSNLSSLPHLYNGDIKGEWKAISFDRGESLRFRGKNWNIPFRQQSGTNSVRSQSLVLKLIKTNCN